MQQSSKTQDRSLGAWFQLVQQGQIKLQRFQRHGDAWDRGRVTSFLETLINNLPVALAQGLKPTLDSVWAARAATPDDGEVESAT